MPLFDCLLLFIFESRAHGFGAFGLGKSFAHGSSNAVANRCFVIETAEFTLGVEADTVRRCWAIPICVRLVEYYLTCMFCVRWYVFASSVEYACVLIHLHYCCRRLSVGSGSLP